MVRFYGATQGFLGMGGEWGIIHLFDSHWIVFFASMGRSTNNHVEMMALKLVMILAHSKGVQKLWVFGNPKLVVEWMKLKRPPKKFY